MTAYYPSLVVNLRLRFDEAFLVEEVPEPLPQSGSIDAISGAAGPVLRPLITAQGGDNLTHILNRVPKRASFSLPGFRQAGTFSMMFDYRELPIDPRLIRAIGVEIFLGTVNPDDYATGMTQVGTDGTRRSILNVFREDGNVDEDKLLMAGVVDTWKMVNDSKGSWLEMEGRDLRGIFLDSPIDLAIFDQLSMDRPISEVVADVLETHSAGEDMTVTTFIEEWPDGNVPFPADVGGLTRPRRKANGQGASVGSQSSSPNYWDIITQLCLLVGAIPYFEGRQLIIRPARGIFSQIRNEQGNSPFRAPNSALPVGRLDQNGEEFFTRRMIFGRNIESLTYERKYTGVKVPVIEVVSLDTSADTRGIGKLLIQRWPPADEKLALISGVSPSGNAAQTDVLRISVPGIRDPKRLLEIAKDTYEEIGRQEIGGECKSKDLASFIGNTIQLANTDPDLLRLRPGHGVEFLIDIQQLNSRTPIASQFTDANRQSFNERVATIKADMLRKTGQADENLIRVIVATSQGSVIDLLRFFRVINIKYTWAMGVVQTSFDFQNYIVVRSGVTPPPPEPPVVPKRRAVRRKTRNKIPRPTPTTKFIKGNNTLGVEVTGDGDLGLPPGTGF